VTAWSDELRIKLAKLIRLLGSPEEGEVVAAARAIQRTLAGESLDLHDLVDTLFPAKPLARSMTPSAQRPSTQQAARQAVQIREVWIASCDSCLQHTNKLSRLEFAFIKSLQRDLVAERPYTRSKTKRLMKICSRLGV
jgi:hypothetical protein